MGGSLATEMGWADDRSLFFLVGEGGEGRYRNR